MYVHAHTILIRGFPLISILQREIFHQADAFMHWMNGKLINCLIH